MMDDKPHYLLITATFSEIESLVPLLVSQEKNISYCISNKTYSFCSICKYEKMSYNKEYRAISESQLDDHANEDGAANRHIYENMPPTSGEDDICETICNILNRPIKVEPTSYEDDNDLDLKLDMNECTRDRTSIEQNHNDQSTSTDQSTDSRLYLAEQKSGIGDDVVIYRRASREYRFNHKGSLDWNYHIYRCSGTLDKKKCRKRIYVRDGFFLTNPTLGHTCQTKKKQGADNASSIINANTQSQLNKRNVLSDAPKVENDPIRILAERLPGIIKDILMHRHPKTGRAFRFSHYKTLQSGIEIYRCTGSINGTSCRKNIRVEDGYFLANPSFGHICKQTKKKCIKKVDVAENKE